MATTLTGHYVNGRHSDTGEYVAGNTTSGGYYSKAVPVYDTYLTEYGELVIDGITESGQFTFDGIGEDGEWVLYELVPEPGPLLITHMGQAITDNIDQNGKFVDDGGVTQQGGFADFNFLSDIGGELVALDSETESVSEVGVLTLAGGLLFPQDSACSTQADTGTLTLNPAFLAEVVEEAQLSPISRPLIQIVSEPAEADIPISGFKLSYSSNVEKQPSAVTLSDNSTVIVHINGNNLEFVYTDAGGTTLTHVIIALTNETPIGVSVCELSDGNIGIAYLYTYGSTYYLKRRIVTKTGVAVSSAVIGSWATSLYTSHPSLFVRGINDYVMVYAKYTGTNYYIYKRTSTDFITWSAESAFTITGVDSTKKLDNPMLVRLLGTNEIELWFDFTESVSAVGNPLTNIYYCVSVDELTSFSAATKFTNFTEYSCIGNHPHTVQKAEPDKKYVLYNREQAIIKYDLAVGSPSVTNLDPVARKYIIWKYWSKEVEVIDIDNWVQLAVWNTTTVPAIDPAGNYQQSQNHKIGKTKVQLMPASGDFVDILDIDANTITKRNFRDVPGSGRTANVVWEGHTFSLFGYVYSTRMDEANNRLYLNWAGEYALVFRTQIGYFDLTEVGPTYTFHVLIEEWGGPYSNSAVFEIFPDEGYIMTYGHYETWLSALFIRIYNITDGGVYKSYSPGSPSTYPAKGIRCLTLLDGYIYAGFPFDSSQPDYRGLCRIDINNDIITYHRPGYATADDYSFWSLEIKTNEPGKIVCYANNGEVAVPVSIFDTASASWTKYYNNDNVPGLYCRQWESWTGHGNYDPIDDWFFIDTNEYIPNGPDSVQMFPGEGALSRTNYYLGEKSVSWTYTDYGRLVKTAGHYNAVAVIDGNNQYGMLVFWETKSGDVMWGKDGSSLDLSDYIVSGTEVSIERSIDGKFNRLEATFSHGYLFDPHNTFSLLRGMFGNGRKLVVKWGERLVNIVDYYTPAGTFYVTDRKVAYKKGVYTDMRIVAEDIRTIWNDTKIFATDYFNLYPETIMSNLLQTFAGALPGDSNFPNFDGRVIVEHQWIDSTLEEITTQLCDRFCYFFKVGADGKYTAGKISDSNAINRTYTDCALLESFGPDDKYSDFVNKVIVQGQERSYISIVYPEERVGVINGTAGWNGGTKHYTIYYSDDKTKTCVNPRLVVIDSAKSMGYWIADIMELAAFVSFDLDDENISESISYVDPDGHYCVVEVKCPDLTANLIASFILLFSSLAIPDIVPVTGGTIRVGTFLTGLQSMCCSAILSAQVSWQYEVYASPTGRIRRSIQAEANDTNFQEEIGMVVPRKIEDPLCYSVAECQFVANNEVMVSRLQRNRIQIVKKANILDEEGHTIQFKHPYTNVDIKTFITRLKRVYKKPDKPNSEGYFLDDIEGWVIQ